MKSRLIGAIVFGLSGFFIGAGTGIVGGAFGGMAGVGVFTMIGVIWGWSAGPDIASGFARMRRRK